MSWDMQSCSSNKSEFQARVRCNGLQDPPAVPLSSLFWSLQTLGVCLWLWFWLPGVEIQTGRTPVSTRGSFVCDDESNMSLTVINSWTNRNQPMAQTSKQARPGYWVSVELFIFAMSFWYRIKAELRKLSADIFHQFLQCPNVAKTRSAFCWFCAHTPCEKYLDELVGLLLRPPYRSAWTPPGSNGKIVSQSQFSLLTVIQHKS